MITITSNLTFKSAYTSNDASNDTSFDEFYEGTKGKASVIARQSYFTEVQIKEGVFDTENSDEILYGRIIRKNLDVEEGTFQNDKL